mmetsp:Transcript_11794/g.36687  ORF Transcript_11794/g.36687 Transcript_11794/m.36687 type:complete len:244 (+) Transcript_11794:3200-3931(+)
MNERTIRHSIPSAKSMIGRTIGDTFNGSKKLKLKIWKTGTNTARYPLGMVHDVDTTAMAWKVPMTVWKAPDIGALFAWRAAPSVLGGSTWAVNSWSSSPPSRVMRDLWSAMKADHSLGVGYTARMSSTVVAFSTSCMREASQMTRTALTARVLPSARTSSGWSMKYCVSAMMTLTGRSPKTLRANLRSTGSYVSSGKILPMLSCHRKRMRSFSCSLNFFCSRHERQTSKATWAHAMTKAISMA